MKQIYLITLFYLFSGGFCQAPAGYYNNATGVVTPWKLNYTSIIKDQYKIMQDCTWETSDIDNSEEWRFCFRYVFWKTQLVIPTTIVLQLHNDA
jgi:hypothetical protein